MKRYRIERLHEVRSECRNPERSAYRERGDFARGVYAEVQEWPNRESMARSIRMQDRGPSRPDHWRAVLPLSPGEGY